MDKDTLKSWVDVITDIDIQIGPIAREHGYSKDALLLAHMINRLANAVESLEEVIKDAS